MDKELEKWRKHLRIVCFCMNFAPMTSIRNVCNLFYIHFNSLMYITIIVLLNMKSISYMYIQFFTHTFLVYLSVLQEHTFFTLGNFTCVNYWIDYNGTIKWVSWIIKHEVIMHKLKSWLLCKLCLSELATHQQHESVLQDLRHQRDVLLQQKQQQYKLVQGNYWILPDCVNFSFHRHIWPHVYILCFGIAYNKLNNSQLAERLCAENRHKCYKYQWLNSDGVRGNLVLSVVKDVPRPWFLASLPSSVWFMCCVKDL